MSMPEGSILIVAYNSEECIDCCLQSIANSPDWKIILVDNASTDDTLVKARANCFPITIIANSQNIGFAGALNQAFDVAEGDVLIVLNPDVIASRGSLDNLALELQAERVGAVGGVLLDNDRRLEKGFTIRRFPTLSNTLAEVLLINRIWPNNPWNRQYRYFDADYMKLQEVDQPAGACLAIKRKAWEEVNGFDENFYPVWFEDVDFCRRLRDRGWKIVYCPRAEFLHTGGHSVNKLGFRDRQSYWYRNLLRYFIKHHSDSAVVCLRFGITTGLLLRLVLSLLGATPSDVSVMEALRGYGHAIWEYGVVGETSKELAKTPCSLPQDYKL